MTEQIKYQSEITSMHPQEDNKDIIVIGGGIIGTCAAYYLALRGRSVTLIEKDDISAGSSTGNAGLISNGFAIPIAAPGVPSQGLKWMLDTSSPFYIKPRLDLSLIRWLWRFLRSCTERQMRRSIPVLFSLGEASFTLLDEIHEREEVDFGYEHKGRIFLFASEKTFNKMAEDADFVRNYGVETSLLDIDGVREIEPNVKPFVKHGLYCSAYAHLDPERFTLEMARLARNYGAELITGTKVTGFETKNGKISVVITKQGAYKAKQVILAAGAWSPLIARDLKLRLPIQPAKGYSLTYQRPSTSPDLPLMLSEKKIAVTPMGDKLRFTSTLELAGYDPAINRRRMDTIRRSAREYLPGMEHLEGELEWSGYRPLTPDDLPILGRSERINNLIFATGHGMMGMTYALVTGKLVSEIVRGEQPSIDLAPFRPERF